MLWGHFPPVLASVQKGASADIFSRGGAKQPEAPQMVWFKLSVSLWKKHRDDVYVMAIFSFLTLILSFTSPIPFMPEVHSQMLFS